MSLKFCIGFDEPLDQAKEITYKALVDTQGVVVDPKPRVLVSNLTAEGVNLTINFWINTNESRPLEVLDKAAIGIVGVLQGAGIEVFPPGSMIVKRPQDAAGEPVEKRESDL